MFDNMDSVEIIWTLIGFGGQALFASRFIIQWFRSEQEGRSIIPVVFWYCSIGGGVVLFSYALYKQDPVFIAGQGLGLFVYARNLYLIFREKRNGAPPAEAKPIAVGIGPQSAQDIVDQQKVFRAATQRDPNVAAVAKSVASADTPLSSNPVSTPEKA